MGYFKRFCVNNNNNYMHEPYSNFTLNYNDERDLLDNYVTPYNPIIYTQGPNYNNAVIATAMFFDSWYENHYHMESDEKNISTNYITALAVKNGVDLNDAGALVQLCMEKGLCAYELFPGNNKAEKAVEMYDELVKKYDKVCTHFDTSLRGIGTPDEAIRPVWFSGAANEPFAYLNEKNTGRVMYAIIYTGPVLARVAIPMEFNLEKVTVNLSECNATVNTVMLTDSVEKSEYAMHYVVIFGYCEQGWIAMNTWGPNFGTEGTFVLPYSLTTMSRNYGIHSTVQDVIALATCKEMIVDLNQPVKDPWEDDGKGEWLDLTDEEPSSENKKEIKPIIISEGLEFPLLTLIKNIIFKFSKKKK